MTTPIEIEVTAEDIALGRPGEPDICAVALAAHRVWPNNNIAVSQNGVSLFDFETDEFLTTFWLSQAGIKFVRDFDINKARCQPTKFKLYGK